MGVWGVVWLLEVAKVVLGCVSAACQCRCLCACYAGDLEGSLKLSVSPHHPRKAQKAVRRKCKAFRKSPGEGAGKKKGEGLRAART